MTATSRPISVGHSIRPAATSLRTERQDKDQTKAGDRLEQEAREPPLLCYAHHLRAQLVPDQSRAIDQTLLEAVHANGADAGGHLQEAVVQTSDCVPFTLGGPRDASPESYAGTAPSGTVSIPISARPGLRITAATARPATCDR